MLRKLPNGPQEETNIGSVDKIFIFDILCAVQSIHLDTSPLLRLPSTRRLDQDWLCSLITSDRANLREVRWLVLWQ